MQKISNGDAQLQLVLRRAQHWWGGMLSSAGLVGMN